MTGINPHPDAKYTCPLKERFIASYKKMKEDFSMQTPKDVGIVPLLEVKVKHLFSAFIY